MWGDDPLVCLQSLGFSEYEAKAYVTLLQRGSLTGYQLAKASGVPRPNVYPVLDRLAERGAVVRVQAKRGVRCSALPAEEMLARLSRSVETQVAEARSALAELETAASAEYVWNVQGYEAVLAQAEAVVDGAKDLLLVGVWVEESRRLGEAFARAQARGVEVSTLCIQGCPDECGGCRGRVYRYPLAADAKARWLVLVADDGQLLAGQVMEDGRATAAETTLEVLVSAGAQYLRNAIAAAEIVRSLGPRLSELLDPQALEAVRGAGLASGGASWFDRMLVAVEAGKA